MQNLDLWLDFVDTREFIPLFEKNAKEYNIPNLKEVDWSKEPEHLIQIAKEKNFSAFNTMKSETQYHHIFSWLWEKGEKELLLKCFKYLLAHLRDYESNSALTLTIIKSMLDFLKQAPFLSLVFIEIDSWASLCPDVYELLGDAWLNILEAYVLSANEMQEFVVEPFKKAISQTQFMSLTNFEGLVELISLTVRSVDIALDLLLECLEPESSRILSGHPALIQQFVRNILGIALDHIDEAAQSQIPRKDLLDLKVMASESGGYPIVESRLRIDAPVGTLATFDHIRLTAANPPTNSAMARVYSIDALVESSQPGSATFRCFHPVPPFVEQCSWELQNCGSFVTTKTMFDAVHAFATQGDCCGISDQILGTQTDTCPPAKSPLVGYIATNDLNTSQNAAVEASLRYPLTCLWGPPGTGKTHTIVRIIKQLQKSPGSKRILVTAPTHNAVDNVMRKYLSSGTAGGQIDVVESNTLRVSTDVSLAVIILPYTTF
jgi:hypothetical protein